MILSLFIFRYILTKLAVKCAFYYLTVVENFMQKSARVVEMSTKVFLLDHSLLNISKMVRYVGLKRDQRMSYRLSS